MVEEGAGGWPGASHRGELSSARIPRRVREKGCRRASPSPAARGFGEGGTVCSPSSLSRMVTPAILRSPAAEGSRQAQDPSPAQWAPPPHPSRGAPLGARAMPGRVAGAGAGHQLSCARHRASRRHGPSRASGARVWVLPPAAAFLPPDCWVLLEEPVWSLHPVPNLQSKLALGPLVSLHPVTSSPACHLPRGVQGCAAHGRSLPVPLARKGGQSPAGGCWLSPWESRLGAGSLPWCKLEQDPVSSADSPLGNGCNFWSFSVSHPCAPTVPPNASMAPGP